MVHLISSWVLKIDDNLYITTNTSKHENGKNMYLPIQIPDSQNPRIEAKNDLYDPRLSFQNKW
jgi:protein-tyrosine phosphatase